MPIHEFAADSTGINRVQIFQGSSEGEIKEAAHAILCLGQVFSAW